MSIKEFDELLLICFSIIGDPTMTNADHTINKEQERQIKEDKMNGDYVGLNFHGEIIYFGDKFYCCVSTYHVKQEVFEAETLEEIMVLVSDKYGWD